MTARIPLLVDVDGVVNVLGPGSGQIRKRGLVRHNATAETGVTYRLFVDPRVGRRLLGLADVFELVWCTTWSNANEAISPLVGLPTDLRQVPTPGSWHGVEIHTGWAPKVPYIRRWAAEHGVTRLAWVDDDASERDSTVLTTAYPAGHPLACNPPLQDALAFHVPPRTGLLPEHFDALRVWAQGR